MSLFYGYSPPDTTVSTTLGIAKGQSKVSNHKTIFDLNVTRASKNIATQFPPFIDFIEDTAGEIHSFMFWRPTGSRPRMNTAGDHHFIYSKSLTRTAFHANVPRLMFPDVSVFVVVKRNSVKNASKKWEVIISNDESGYDKTLGFKAGVNDKLISGGSYPARFNECSIPAKFVGKKVLISIHWLSGSFGPGASHVRINGETLKDSFFITNVEQIGKPYLGVFSLNHQKKYHSNINFYGMKIVEGRLGDKDIKEICSTMVTEHDL